MRTRERYTYALGATAMLVAVLGVGGAPRPVLAVVAAVVAAALALQVTSRRRGRRSPLTLVIAAAVALTALQLVPLPAQVVGALDPVGEALRRDGGQLLGEDAAWTPLSRDPAGTRYGLAYLIVLGGAALIALRIAASERGRFLLVAAVAAVGGLAALVTALHELTGATALYGLYRPAFATPVLLGPLLNPNHLGCLFAMSAVAAAGLALHAPQPAALRIGWALTAAATVAGALATLSRGATLALLAGGLVLAAALIGQRLRGRDRRAAAASPLTANAVGIGVVAMCALALVVYGSGRGVAEQLRETTGQEWSQPGSKYMAWRSAGHLVAEAPWLGVGRGAFETSFTRVHPASGRVTFSHPENEYVQAVVEWGVPGGLVLAGLVGWLAVVAARRWRGGAVAAAALGAVAVVAVQSVVDFGLELPGLGVPTVAVLAVLAHVPLREGTAAQLRRARVGRVAAVAAAVAAGALLLSAATRRVAEDHQALAATRPPSLAAARPVIARHPHDYLAFAYAGDALARAGDPRAMRWINHALRLHPTHPGTHRAAARLLLARGAPRQAALEYATAMRGAVIVRPLVQEVVRAFADPELAATAIPTAFPVPEHIARVLEELNAGAVAVRWLLRVAEEHPTAPRVGELLMAAASARGERELAEQGARLRVQQEGDAAALLALGRLLLQRRALDEAAQVLESAPRAAGRPDVVAAAWLLLCDVEAERARWAAARACLLGLRDAQRDTALLLEIARRLERVARGALETPAVPATGEPATATPTAPAPAAPATGETATPTATPTPAAPTEQTRPAPEAPAPAAPAAPAGSRL